MPKEIKTDCTKIEVNEDSLLVAGDTVELTDEQHKALLNYLTSRLDKSMNRRLRRLSRFAKIDQRITTWMKLSPEDTKRKQVEDDTGRSQALPMNMPILQAHIDDTVAFFCEVFAPLGGNFYATPSGKEKTPQMEKLVSMMNRDTKINSYYSHLAFAMRQFCKYNVSGFEVYWNPGNTEGVGGQQISGNIVEAVDMYNVMWDESIEDVHDIAKKSEWVARPMIRNRMWFVKAALEGRIINADKILGVDPDPSRYGSEYTVAKVENDEDGEPYNVAKWYRNPPSQTNMEVDGSDTEMNAEETLTGGVDWKSYGLGLKDDSLVAIPGHEVVRMYCWINPNQFNLIPEGGEEKDGLELWRFLIVDGTVICLAERIEDAIEIPVYLGRVNKDNMRETMRSISELQTSFQRFVSFLFNTHVEGIRGAIWGTRVYDPTAVDVSGIKKGDVAGLLPSKTPGRDVRTIFDEIRNDMQTRTNMADAASVMDFMKQLFPNQSLPAQIAGMDRAVNSQVSAVLQGTMRKMHMLVRVIDGDVMLPTRQAQYRNLSANDDQAKQLVGINEEDVADLLSSGLGQLNREAAAGQLRDLIFAIIQNQEAMGTFDVAGLFRVWSLLTNTGIDLGDFVKQPAQPPVDPNQQPQPGQQPVDPNATTATAVA